MVVATCSSLTSSTVYQCYSCTRSIIKTVHIGETEPYKDGDGKVWVEDQYARILHVYDLLNELKDVRKNLLKNNSQLFKLNNDLLQLEECLGMHMYTDKHDILDVEDYYDSSCMKDVEWSPDEFFDIGLLKPRRCRTQYIENFKYWDINWNQKQNCNSGIGLQHHFNIFRIHSLLNSSSDFTKNVCKHISIFADDIVIAETASENMERSITVENEHAANDFGGAEFKADESQNSQQEAVCHKACISKEWMTILLLFFMVSNTVATQLPSEALNVKPSEPIQIGSDIHIQCVKVKNDSKINYKWTGGPARNLLTFNENIRVSKSKIGLSISEMYYNLTIKDASLEDANAIYTCHEKFVQQSTKILTQYQYEVLPTNKTIHISQEACGSEGFNDTVIFEEIYPVPNCTVYTNGDQRGISTYSVKMSNKYVYQVNLSISIDCYSPCSVLMKCKIGSTEVVYDLPAPKLNSIVSGSSTKDERTTVTILVFVIGIAITRALLLACLAVVKYKRYRKKQKKSEVTDPDEGKSMVNFSHV